MQSSESVTNPFSTLAFFLLLYFYLHLFYRLIFLLTSVFNNWLYNIEPFFQFFR